MQYISTRNANIGMSAAEVIAMGLAHDGGLFVPEALPALKKNTVAALAAMGYQQRAVYIMSMFLDGYSIEELTDIAEKAYNTNISFLLYLLKVLKQAYLLCQKNDQI